MAGGSWIDALMTRSIADIKQIAHQSTKDYFTLLESIASDIYESCIKDYYRQYDPVIYTRHGNKEGFNLFRANDIMYDSGTGAFDIDLESDNLLPYGGLHGYEVREKVLNSVIKGIRGSKSRRSASTGKWPKRWTTSYPNAYSKHSEWQSSYNTIDDIFDDFIDNVVEDTKEIFLEYVQKNMLL